LEGVKHAIFRHAPDSYAADAQKLRCRLLRDQQPFVGAANGLDRNFYLPVDDPLYGTAQFPGGNS
jgi:hypothetical protein